MYTPFSCGGRLRSIVFVWWNLTFQTGSGAFAANQCPSDFMHEWWSTHTTTEREGGRGREGEGGREGEKGGGGGEKEGGRGRGGCDNTNKTTHIFGEICCTVALSSYYMYDHLLLLAQLLALNCTISIFTSWIIHKEQFQVAKQGYYKHLQFKQYCSHKCMRHKFERDCKHVYTWRWTSLHAFANAFSRGSERDCMRLQMCSSYTFHLSGTVHVTWIRTPVEGVCECELTSPARGSIHWRWSCSRESGSTAGSSPLDWQSPGGWCPGGHTAWCDWTRLAGWTAVPCSPYTCRQTRENFHTLITVVQGRGFERVASQTPNTAKQ